MKKLSNGEKLYKEVYVNGVNYVLFKRGPFCQWTWSRFEENGVIYNSAEQYMMYKKADLFGDFEMRDRIKHCENSAIIKKYGRMVRNFNEDVWIKERERIVYDGNRLKFNQCAEMKNELLKYAKGSVFAECSSFDNVWGIGFNEDGFFKWLEMKDGERGSNLLGEILTKIRNEL